MIMTRINAGIGIRELCDQHLVSEYRELPRVWAMLHNAIEREASLHIPDEFCLGEGHMAYFQDKGAFLQLRWMGLRSEMVCRGMTPTLDWRPWPPIYKGRCLTQDIPTPQLLLARELLIERINERLATMWSHPNTTKHPRWSQRERPAWVIPPCASA
jgi:hypothetical protein